MALMQELMQKVITTLNPSLDKQFAEAVLKRLDSFGYMVKETDAWMIGFAMEKVQNTIRNECNISSIPDGLFHIAVDMSCGEFLLCKKQSGQLEINNLDLVGAISSIKEGDTQVNFNNDESDSEKFDIILNYLLNHGKGELVCYRKIKW